jgi:hypothetical protein
MTDFYGILHSFRDIEGQAVQQYKNSMSISSSRQGSEFIVVVVYLKNEN